jgi:hypothetical protein
VIQGAALVTLVVNVAALWKQEARDTVRAKSREQPAMAGQYNTTDLGLSHGPQPYTVVKAGSDPRSSGHFGRMLHCIGRRVRG